VDDGGDIDDDDDGGGEAAEGLEDMPSTAAAARAPFSNRFLPMDENQVAPLSLQDGGKT